MMNLTTRFTLTITAAMLAFSPQSGFAQRKGSTSPSYAIIPLSTAGGGVQDLNASGKMVGRTTDGSYVEATHWSIDSQNLVISTTLNSSLWLIDEDLPEPEPVLVTLDSEAMGINDQGIIVGSLGDWARNAGSGFYGGTSVVWTNTLAAPRVLPSPVLEPVYTPDYQDIAEVEAVSNQPTAYSDLKAVAVGRYIHYVDPFDPTDDNSGGGLARTYVLAWAITADDEIRAPLVLGIADGIAGVNEDNSGAVDVNGQLTVAGNLNSQAVRWQLNWDSDLRELTLQSTLALFPSLSASVMGAINEAGDICGYRPPGPEAFLLDGDSLVNQTLVKLSGKQGSSNAAALNSLAVPQVVGSVLVSGHITPVVWKGSSVVNLEKATPSLTIEITWASSINNAGWIAGSGWDGARRQPIVLKPQ